MVIEIRLYKRYDADLVALYDSGVNIMSMMAKAVIGYAHGVPVHFIVDEPGLFNDRDKKTFRSRFEVPNSDQDAIRLMKGIKRGYRNSFCKMLLRNALIQQNLSGFFADATLIKMHSNNLTGECIERLQNVEHTSFYKGRDVKHRLDTSNIVKEPVKTETISQMTEPVITKEAKTETTITDSVANTNPFVESITIDETSNDCTSEKSIGVAPESEEMDILSAFNAL